MERVLKWQDGQRNFIAKVGKPQDCGVKGVIEFRPLLSFGRLVNNGEEIEFLWERRSHE